jgi:molybdate transport system substrate-binding protein
MRAAVLGMTVVVALGAARAFPAEPRERVLVAAAADLRFALEDAATKFVQEQWRFEVKTSYGASGSLLAQIENGAPFDLFLSADIDHARRLVAGHRGSADTLFAYGQGRLVLWVLAVSPVADLADPVAALRDPRVRTIAIANPAHAPYGRAAVAALRTLGVEGRPTRRLVLGENVAQAAQFVESGAADVGLISLSLALAPLMKEHGRTWEIPPSAYPAFEQGGVVPTSARNAPGGRAFATWLRSDQGRAVLERFGFTPLETARP